MFKQKYYTLLSKINGKQFKDFTVTVLCSSFLLQGCINSSTQSDVVGQGEIQSQDKSRITGYFQSISSSSYFGGMNPVFIDIEVIKARTINRDTANQRRKFLKDQIEQNINVVESAKEYNKINAVLNSNSSGIFEIITNNGSYKIDATKNRLKGGGENDGIDNSGDKERQVKFSTRLPETMSAKLKELCNLPPPKLKEFFLSIPSKRKEAIEKTVIQKPKDLSELTKLIHNAVEASVKTNGKDIVFLSGGTGVGKSTMLHHLSGIELVKVKKGSIALNPTEVEKELSNTFSISNILEKEEAGDEYQELRSIKSESSIYEEIGAMEEDMEEDFDDFVLLDIEDYEPKQKQIGKEEVKVVEEIKAELKKEETGIDKFVLIPKKEIAGFKVGHGESETKQINVLDNGSFTIVDTAGLLDTNGPVYDLANIVGLERALLNANSVKMLYMIRESTILENRGGPLRDLIKELLGCVRAEVPFEEFMSTVSVIISHPTYKETVLMSEIKGVADRTIAEDEVGCKVKRFISAIVDNLEKGNAGDSPLNYASICTIDKMTTLTNSKEIIESLKASPAIKNPKKTFRVSIEGKAKAYLETIMLTNIKTVLELTKIKEYSIIKEYLVQMHYLSSKINSKSVKRAFEECLKHMQDSMEEVFSSFKSNLDSFMSERGSLDKGGIEILQRDLDLVKEAELLLQSFHSKNLEGRTVADLYEHMAKKMKMVANFTSKELIEGKNTGIIESNLQKMEMIYLYFGKDVPEVSKVYKEFSIFFKETVSSKISDAKVGLEVGNYNSFAESLKEIRSLQDVAVDYFGYDLKKIGDTLASKANESLKIRYEKEIEPLLEEITLEKIPLIIKEYAKWNYLRGDFAIIKQLNSNTLIECNNAAQSRILQTCFDLIKEVNEMMKKKEFDSIQNSILILKDLRNVDSMVAIKTTDDYAQLISRIELDVVNNSKNLVDGYLEKLRSNRLTAREIEELKEIVYKLKKMVWIEPIIGKRGITDIYDSVVVVLEKEVTGIVCELNDTVYADLRAYEKEDIFSGKVGESYDTSESDILKKKGQLMPSDLLRRFVKLNSHIAFVKSLSGISSTLNGSFLQMKEKISQIVKKELALVKLSAENFKTFELHKIQLDRQFIRLISLKDINLDQMHEIDDTLQRFSSELKQYIEYVMDQIANIDLNNYIAFNNKVESFSKVLISLDKCDLVLRDLGIDRLKLNENFINVLSDRFDGLYTDIELNIYNQKFSECKIKLDVLGKYKRSTINSLLKDSINLKCRALLSEYNIKINDAPKNIELCFKSGEFGDLIVLLEEYRSTNNHYLLNKTIADIAKSIEASYEDLLDDILAIPSGDDISFKNLNASLKRFSLYEQLEKAVPSIDYKSKQKEISNSIKSIQSQYIALITKNINNLNFTSIKKDISDLGKLKTIVLKGIPDKEYELQELDLETTLLRGKIKSIIDEELKNNYIKYFSYLDKFMIVDQQYGYKSYEQYKQKLKKHITGICTEIEASAKKTNSVEELEKLQSDLKQIRDDTFECIMRNAEFSYLREVYLGIDLSIEGYMNNLMPHDKYDEKYLQVARNKNIHSYNNLISEITAEYKSEENSILDFLNTREYRRLSVNLENLSKFYPLDSYIYGRGGRYRPSELYSRVFKNIFEVNSDLKKTIRKQLIEQDFTNATKLAKITEFFNIHRYMQFNTEKSDEAATVKEARELHKEIIAFIEQVIPNIGSSRNIVHLENRLQALSKYSPFIDIVKKYVEDMVATNKLSFYSADMEAAVQSLETPVEFEKIIRQVVEDLPKSLTKYWNLGEFNKIAELLIDVKKISSKIVTKEYNFLVESIRNSIDELGRDINLSIKSEKFKDLEEKINRIKRAENELNVVPGLLLKSVYIEEISTLEKKIEREIVDRAMLSMTKEGIKKVVFPSIIELKQWVNNLPILEKFIDGKIRCLLKEVNDKKGTNIIVSELGDLSKDKEHLEQATIAAAFLRTYAKELSIPRILPKNTLSVEHALSAFRAEENGSIVKIDTVELRKVYDIYFKEYEELKKTYVADSSCDKIDENLSSIKTRTKNLLGELKDRGEGNEFSNKARVILPKILASLFAYWTVSKSAESYYSALTRSEEDDENDSEGGNESQEEKNASSFLLQPHPVQVLSILRFLGCDKKDNAFFTFVGLSRFGLGVNRLENHLMQILTGEGKSVILGTMSLLLALMGNNVTCACYSSYLKERDYDDFKDLFVAYNVFSKIKYGTFSEIAEDMINEKGDVRELACDLFSSKTKEIQMDNSLDMDISDHDGDNILLVDEVDTFFSDQLYGNTYNPATTLQTKELLEIIDCIWKNQGQNPTQIESLYKATAAYAYLNSNFSSFIGKLDAQFKSMVNDVKIFKNRPYVLQDRKIGYKNLDGVSFTSSYGYETMFLGLYEYERGNIDERLKNARLGISLKCGSFSFAEIVNNFDKIFGVSGTLENLNDFEKKILSKYEIGFKTYTPSVYGESKRDMKPILIEKGQGAYYQIISSKISEALAKKRAILVFFDSEKSLLDFKKSGYCAAFEDRLNVVTEETKNRQHYISKATESGRVTLFTAVFGRGTDFVVDDPIVKEIGGLDVIQTFLSEELSEETQIQGRTARQGSEGTYQLILQLESLETKFSITQDMISKARLEGGSLKSLLNESRAKYVEVKNKERQKKVDEAKLKHDESIKNRDLMVSGKLDVNKLLS